jgi:hypothetical protein
MERWMCQGAGQAYLASEWPPRTACSSSSAALRAPISFMQVPEEEATSVESCAMSGEIFSLWYSIPSWYDASACCIAAARSRKVCKIIV